MARARAAVLSFGLVSIPVEIFPATKNESVTFNGSIRNAVLASGVTA